MQKATITTTGTVQSGQLGRESGVVRSYSESRAFGIIAPSDSGQRYADLFFHLSDTQPVQHLPPGTTVSFEVQPRTDRPGLYRAVRVKVKS